MGLGAFATVHAQDTDGGAPSDEPVAEEQGTGFFAVGTQFTDLAPLNDRLSGAGYPTFASEMVSLGGGGLQLDIENEGSADNFDDVLDDPNRSASVTRASLLVHLGGGLEYQFGTPGKGRTARLGLRAGYMISALSSDWQLGDSSLPGGPDASLQGPFLRLTIGGVDVSGDDD